MKRVIMIIAAVLLLLIAVLIVLYPMISNYVNNKYQSTIRTEYEAELQGMDDTALQDARAAAEAYNSSLAPIQFNREGIAAASVDYNELLNLSGSGIMGYVQIEKIGVNLPIYHGTGETVLEEGVGHLIGSSLPIGGQSTHAILTGHSGVAGKKLFSDIDQLEIGDVFLLRVLGETLAYQVIEINTVLPHETALLEPVSGEDLCTLVTCTPFGVNSHRLLVRGRRIPYEAAEEIIEQAAEEQPEPMQSTWEAQYITGLLIGGGGALVIAAVVIVLLLLRRKKRKTEAATSETEEAPHDET
ncbi:MAG: class C sortase [Oscillospiraceae bacterium]|nr:class C sortase [Oscillospiraceae bacterium]